MGLAPILVIDDESEMRSALSHALTRNGFSVESAASGMDALVRIKKDPFSLVITDIVMPDKEGIETIMEIRRMAPSIKIIAISGGGRIRADSYLDLARKLGATETFPKPVDRKKLLETIDKVLT